MDPCQATSPFLRLPPNVRQKIYSYLLSPSTSGELTTINYELDFRYLQHPSSTTFTAHHLDICHCPQQGKGKGHIYTRYLCSGPKVIIRPKSQSFWLLDRTGSAFNILRPPTQEEIKCRPDAGIIGVNKLIYRESLPFLYKGRNFLLLTGICSRGRYQAYATQIWLEWLSPIARENVTALSLMWQRMEEDCQDADVREAYRSLTHFILEEVPRLTYLRLNVWCSMENVWPFELLVERRNGARICVRMHENEGEMQEDGYTDRVIENLTSQPQI
jgi:hypothetical protein